MGLKTAIVILAAGMGKRFIRSGAEQPSCKLTLPYQGKTLIEYVVSIAEHSKADHIFLITGYSHPQIKPLFKGHSLTILYNPKYETGMSESLKLAAKELPQDIEGAIFMLADMPLITPDILNELIEAFQTSKGQKIIIPTIKDKRGNPLLWPAKFFGEFEALSGDIGAKKLLTSRQYQILVLPLKTAQNDLEIFFDVDSAEDYQKLLTLS